MRFFTSDTHFGHARIIELCNRPFASVHEMNEAIIDNWNHVVGEDDTVFHLGDVALGPWVEWDSILTRLNGYKVLVVGNHERIFKGEKQKQIDRFMPEYQKWFDEIHGNLPFTLTDGTRVNLSHFPYDGDSHDGDRFVEARVVDLGTTLLHGHTHLNQIVSRSERGTLQVHVGQDAWHYTPVSEEQIITLINSQED